MNRRGFIGSLLVALAAPSAALAKSRDKTIPYVPLDARPYYDPITELRREHVDARIWPAVQAINRSGWVWTAESCEGHEVGWSHVPMIRLVCRTENVGRMLSALALSQSVGDPSSRTPVFNGEGRVELRRHNPAPRGWYEVRVYVKRGGVAVFERFAERIR